MTTTLQQMIRDRHAGDGWAVVLEMPNSTGTSASRRLDALAMGLWPSNQFAVHGFEIKISRGDLKRELVDPAKSDAISRFCDYFWLVVSDLAIAEDLAIPEAWGVLYPVRGSLRAHKKAQKLEALPPSRGFVAALVRKVFADYVPKHKYQALVEDVHRRVTEGIANGIADNLDTETKAIKRKIDEFKESSGIDLTALPAWEAGNVGAAVKVVLEVRKLAEPSLWHERTEAIDLVRREIRALERQVEQHAAAQKSVRDALARLNEYAAKFKQGAA